MTHYHAHSLLTHLIRMSIFVLFVCVVAYLYLVQVTVLRVVERRDLEERRIALTGELAHMEARYIAQAGTFTIERAYALGFSDASSRTAFAYSPASQVSVARGNVR